MDVNLIAQALIVICAGIVGLGGAGAVVVKAAKPISVYAKRLEQVEAKLDTDWRRMEKLEAADRVICRGLVVVLDSIAGNEINGNVEKAKADIQNWLIEK